MRRPSLKSTVYMALLAAGIVTAGALIWRGTGAPTEPARAVMPGEAVIDFPQAGTYVIFVEQVIAPRATEYQDLAAPKLSLRLDEVPADNGNGPARTSPPIKAPDKLDWFLKVLTKRRGHTFGSVRIPAPGRYRLRGTGPAGGNQAVLAFARPASLGRLLWLLLGFSGQICFSLRFIIQWLASEKAGRSTVPRAFWYYSMVGGLMILAYAIYTRDPVFIMAYAFNAFIYVRNLVLIRREDRAAAPAPTTPES